MPTEIFKIVAVAIIAFGLGTTFLEGRQTLEISNLNNKISQLEKQLSQKEKQLNTAQSKAKTSKQKLQEVLKSWD